MHMAPCHCAGDLLFIISTHMQNKQESDLYSNHVNYTTLNMNNLLLQ